MGRKVLDAYKNFQPAESVLAIYSQHPVRRDLMHAL